MDSQTPDALPGAAIDAAPDTATDTAPAALTDLIAAGLVSHEMIGDPALLGAEAPTLATLCGLIGGPVYRIDPFHYAFRAGPGDLGGRLGSLAAGAWTAALEAELRAGLGEEAVWLSATDPAPVEAAALDQPLLLLRAHAAAVAEAIETVGPGPRAVIDARYAAETARLTARLIGVGEAGGTLARRLVAIESRQEEILERLTDALAERARGPDPLLARLTQTLGEISQRLEAQDAGLRAQAARLDALAERLAPAGEPEAFQRTLGLTLAEFLARLEHQAEQGAPGRPPRLS